MKTIIIFLSLSCKSKAIAIFVKKVAKVKHTVAALGYEISE